MTAAASSQRSYRVLEEQKNQLRWFLRSSISVEDAEAMASAGYRAFGRCGNCGERGCEWCDVDPLESGRSSKQRLARHDPRYVKEVIGRLVLFPNFLYTRVPLLLNRLPPEERLVLLLELGVGLPVETVARRLKIHRNTATRLREHGLERIARAVWNDDGSPFYG